MKKIITTLLFVMACFSLVSCSETKFKDDNIYVHFYNYENNSFKEKVTPNELINEPEIPVRIGYAFKNYTYKGKVWDFKKDKALKKSFILEAEWEERDYRIEYELNGGKFENPNEVISEFKAGTHITLVKPIKFGYEFLGWVDYDFKDTKPNNNNIHYVLTKDKTIKDFKVYAYFEPRKSQIKYNLNKSRYNDLIVDASVDDLIKFTYQVDFETEINDLLMADEMISDNYNFIGWNTKEDGSGVLVKNGDKYNKNLIPNLVFPGNLYLYAIWERK